MIANLQTSLKRTVILTGFACLVLGWHSSVASASWGSHSHFQSSQTKQPATRQAVLLVDTDDACHLFIDDEDKGEITPADSQKFKVGFGDHILKCTVVGVPDLVWRKIVSVKDSSQVAAVIALKALHLQYQQAVTKAKNEEEAASANAQKRLEEAEAEQKQRAAAQATVEAAKAEIPQKMFDMVKGDWHAAASGNYEGMALTVAYQYHFEAIENGLIIGYLTTANGKMKYKVTFTPTPPNLLQAVSQQCFATKNGVYMQPGSKGKDGWGICKGQPAATLGGTDLQIKGNTLTGVDGFNFSFTLTR